MPINVSIIIGFGHQLFRTKICTCFLFILYFFIDMIDWLNYITWRLAGAFFWFFFKGKFKHVCEIGAIVEAYFLLPHVIIFISANDLLLVKKLVTQYSCQHFQLHPNSSLTHSLTRIWKTASAVKTLCSQKKKTIHCVTQFLIVLLNLFLMKQA